MTFKISIHRTLLNFGIIELFTIFSSMKLPDMRRRFRCFVYIILTIVLVAGCKKDEEPAPEDLFVGNYSLVEVEVEFDPEDPDRQGDPFLAPEGFQVTKSDLLNPVTGEMVPSYKLLIDDIFLGLIEQEGSGGTALVGTQACPNDDDIRAASITFLESELYSFNMLNCIGREVLATYSRVVEVE